tara:strand:+ start:111 stop:1292 length:1182 start_codon:yes stop_codon:yes gene_type:complete
MAITNKEKGVWSLDQVYNKINQGSIWEYNGPGDPDKVFGWGLNNYGQLGLNQPHNTAYSSPVQIPGSYKRVFPTNQNSDYHIVAGISTTGLVGWGRNNYGQLLQNDTVDRSSPVQLPGTTWYNVAGGEGALLATKTDNSLWAWGVNTYGNLGQNNRTQYSSPVQIPGTTWKQPRGTNTSNGAIKTDGTLWVWGRNWRGGLGQNNLIEYSSPVQIPGTNWKYLANQGSTMLAIKTDGTLWGWGRQWTGALGQNQSNGTNDNFSYSSPVQIPGTNWANIGCGGAFQIAVKTDGTLWSWGYQNRGQLGLNSNTNYSSPVQVGSDTTWPKTGEIHAGTTTGLIKTDGTLWMWGNSGQGQIGKNDTVQYSSPVQVPGTWAELDINSWYGSTIARPVNP